MESGPREAARRGKRGERMPTFTFLGFLHVWGQGFNKKAGNKFWRVKRRTCPLRYRKKLAELSTYIKANRHHKWLLAKIKSVVQGYLNYFAINDNQRRVQQFVWEVKWLLYKWLNRRSQKRSLNWDEFEAIMKKIEFPNSIRLRNIFSPSKSTELRLGVCR